MTETPGEHLTEEPQSERGPMGSRDTGSDEPASTYPDRTASIGRDALTETLAPPAPIERNGPCG